MTFLNRFKKILHFGEIIEYLRNYQIYEASFEDIVIRKLTDHRLGKFATKMIPLNKYTAEYTEVLKHLSSNIRSRISSIDKIYSPSLYGWYMIKKAEYESRGFKNCERTLLHVTGASNIPSILKSNLNWRRVSRHKFGKGVSFSDDADYANQYAAMSIGLNRAIIIADVLIGRSYPGSSSTDLPPARYDTTTGNSKVYVKFYDDEFLPKYVAYYTSAPIVPKRTNRYTEIDYDDYFF